MTHFGEHLTYDGHEGDYDALDCRATVVQALNDLVAALDMTLLGGPDVYRAPASNKKGPGGWTGMVVPQESQISIYTFPARGFVSADVYTCGRGCHQGFSRARFKIVDEEVHFIQRGMRYPLHNIF